MTSTLRYLGYGNRLRFHRGPLVKRDGIWQLAERSRVLSTRCHPTSSEMIKLCNRLPPTFVRLFWTWRVRCGQPGRPLVSSEVRDLIPYRQKTRPGRPRARTHCSAPFEDRAGPGGLLPGEIPSMLNICDICAASPSSVVPSTFMPLPFRSTSAGPPVVLDTALLPCSLWACSSAGRALALQAVGRAFESPHVHHFSNLCLRPLTNNLQLMGCIRAVGRAAASRSQLRA
jgi:hypothetical protein